MSRSQKCDNQRNNSTEYDESSHPPVQNKEYGKHKNDSHHGRQEFAEEVEQYHEDIIRSFRELFRELSRVRIRVISHRETESMREVLSDRSTKLLMRHAIRIDRDEEL